MNTITIQQATTIIQRGGVIAYPTESVYGLGCDPMQPTAVEKILKIKNRHQKKGLILIASDWAQVAHFIQPVASDALKEAHRVWPGPYTWVFPANHHVPPWIRGEHTGVAIRITAHPVCRALCTAINGPIVSTSANLSGKPSIRNIHALRAQLGKKIEGIVAGELGGAPTPCRIQDVQSGKILRH